jgi:hypothetical protein
MTLLRRKTVMSYYSSFKKISLTTSLVIQAFTLQVHANQKIYQKALQIKQQDQPAVVAAAAIKMLAQKQLTQKPFISTIRSHKI